MRFSGLPRRAHIAPRGRPPQFASDLLANLVEGFTAEFHDVKAVEADLGVGEVFGGSGNEGPGHVHGDLVDLVGRDAPALQFGGELREGVGVLAGGEEQQPGDFGRTPAPCGLLALDFEENRAVFVPFAGGGFVGSEPFERCSNPLPSRPRRPGCGSGARSGPR